MRTANPALREEVFTGLRASDSTDVMTVQGVVNKTALLFLCMLLTAGWTWSLYYTSQDSSVVAPWMVGGAIIGFILAIITVFKLQWAPILAPLYALAQGFFIGGISATVNASYPGIVVQAASLTFGVLAMMLFLYKTGVINVTDNFRMGIVAATGGIALVYLVSIVLGFFGIAVPFIQGNSMFSIVFSVFVVAIAALNLVLDFDTIDRGAARGLPKFMDWYGAFALMVTLVWLYIEILRLLTKIRDRG